MRGKIVFVVLLLMTGALFWLVATRERDAHVMPQARVEPVATGESADAGAPTNASASASSSASGAPLLDAAAPVDAGAPLLDRPVRVVASSWEAAAAAILANGGRTTADGSAAHAAGLQLQIEVAPARDADNRLARGGADAAGADLVLAPLPDVVATSEKLRALELQVFFVVGWSHGREVLLGSSNGVLAKTPGVRDAVVVSDDPSAATLAVFALAHAGVAPDHVRVAGDAEGATFAALARPLPADRSPKAPSRMLVTTAEAARLVPIVAAAPRAFLAAHRAALAALVRAWLEGAADLRKDVAAAARRITSEPSAPDPAALIGALGWMTTSDAADESRSLDEARIGACWRAALGALRSAGAITGASDVQRSIVDASAFAAIGQAPVAATPQVPASPNAPVLLAHRFAKTDATEVGLEMHELAQVFDRSVVRVSSRPPSLAKDAASIAHDKGVPSEAIVVSPAPPGDGSAAVVEVLGAP